MATYVSGPELERWRAEADQRRTEYENQIKSLVANSRAGGTPEYLRSVGARLTKLRTELGILNQRSASNAWRRVPGRFAPGSGLPVFQYVGPGQAPSRIQTLNFSPSSGGSATPSPGTSGGGRPATGGTTPNPTDTDGQSVEQNLKAARERWFRAHTDRQYGRLPFVGEDGTKKWTRFKNPYYKAPSTGGGGGGAPSGGGGGGGVDVPTTPSTPAGAPGSPTVPEDLGALSQPITLDPYNLPDVNTLASQIANRNVAGIRDAVLAQLNPALDTLAGQSRQVNTRASEYAADMEAWRRWLDTGQTGLVNRLEATNASLQQSAQTAYNSAMDRAKRFSEDAMNAIGLTPGTANADVAAASGSPAFAAARAALANRDSSVLGSLAARGASIEDRAAQYQRENAAMYANMLSAGASRQASDLGKIDTAEKDLHAKALEAIASGAASAQKDAMSTATDLLSLYALVGDRVQGRQIDAANAQTDRSAKVVDFAKWAEEQNYKRWHDTYKLSLDKLGLDQKAAKTVLDATQKSVENAYKEAKLEIDRLRVDNDAAKIKAKLAEKAAAQSEKAAPYVTSTLGGGRAARTDRDGNVTPGREAWGNLTDVQRRDRFLKVLSEFRGRFKYITRSEAASLFTGWKLDGKGANPNVDILATGWGKAAFNAAFPKGSDPSDLV